MKPAKRILLIDSDETRQSIRRFLFHTHLFAVVSASTAAEAREIVSAEHIDLVVCAWPLSGLDAGVLLEQLHQANPAVPSMLLAEHRSIAPQGLYAEAMLLKGSCSAAEIIERAKMLSSRKRGPRKAQPNIDRMMDLSERRIA